MKTRHKQQTNFLTLIWVILSCIFTGGLIGATTNAINGAVSPKYFQNVLGWNFHDIWSASIAQGIFEGLMYGVLFSIVFGATIAIVTKSKASYQFALHHLIKVIGVVYLCWVLGGLIAMGLASLSPEFYRQTFIKVPDDYKEMLGYAWVGGSIWGGMIGGLLGLVISIFGIRTSWNTEQ